MPAVLELRAVSRALRAGVAGCSVTALVLRDVTLRIDAGERVALCGPDRAAATALMLCAAGIMRPDSGVVRTLGPAAYVPAEASSLGGLTVAEALEWQRRSLASGDAPRRSVREVLETAECAALASVRTRLVSPAALRRLALARALLARPAIVLVDRADDEHADERAQMARALANVATLGVAVAFAARDAGEVDAGVRVVHLRASAARRAEPAARGRAVRRDGGESAAAARRAVAERFAERAVEH